MEFKCVTLRKRPELAKDIGPLHRQFPRFIVAGDRTNRLYWIHLYEDFPDFQFALCDSNNEVVACGHAIPLVWDGSVDGLPSGYDAALERGFECMHQGKQPNTLCALAAITSSEYKKIGLSYQIVTTMKSLAKFHGLSALIAPVRPTWKDRYPLIPMENYVKWVRKDGSPFDPWLRVHWRLGGSYMCIAQTSMTVWSTIQEWEEWTGMTFPESGQYVVPQALNPVQIDLQTNCGVYIEPNVWMKHTIE